MGTDDQSAFSKREREERERREIEDAQRKILKTSFVQSMSKSSVKLTQSFAPG
jgi:hypothetical protein